MNKIILCKLGEMVLKGLNRSTFERKLIANLQRRLAPMGDFGFSCQQSCLYITPPEGADLDAVCAIVNSVFGIVAYSVAFVLDKDMDSLLVQAPDLLSDLLMTKRSFKVEAKRADKRFGYNSMQIMQQLGGLLHDTFTHLTVDVHNPDCVVVVEVREQAIYLHAGSRPGAGGLPVGSSGTGTLLISGGIDSPVAGYLMARRGLQLHAVHFESYPYTSQQALDKVLTLAEQVARYAGRIEVDVVGFTKLQERLRAACDEDYFTLLMRRSMIRIAAQLAHNHKSQCLITGESLGQVASQTVGALAVTDCAAPEGFDGNAPYPVLRPLIGMDKAEVIAIARKIGTFETSILPYEDCCTVFTPRHPRTRPVYADILKNEQKADLHELEQQAVACTERKVAQWRW